MYEKNKTQMHNGNHFWALMSTPERLLRGGPIAICLSYLSNPFNKVEKHFSKQKGKANFICPAHIINVFSDP
jgi:hypothetical protein